LAAARLYFSGIVGETGPRQHHEFATVQMPRPSAPAGVLVQGTYHDFDELAREVHGWGLNWLQLDRGPLTASIRQIGTPAAVVARFEFSRKFHQRGSPPPGMRTIGLPCRGAPPVEWRGREAPPDSFVLFPSEDNFDFVSRPGFCGNTVSVATDRLCEVAATTGRRDPDDLVPRGAAILASPPDRTGALRSLLTVVHEPTSQPTGNGLIARNLEWEVACRVLDLFDETDGDVTRSPRASLRDRALRRAVEFIEAHADEPPTIEQVCEAAGASWRTINYGFRDRFDVTAKQYLHTFRLRRLRRDLLNATYGSTVWEIAAVWGFWHMGKLATDYRRQFGELPSATLRRG